MSFEHYYAGSQNPEDVAILECALSQFKGEQCRFLEIGVLTGQTARGIKQSCEDKEIRLEYWGIDQVSPETHNQPREPFPGAHFIHGDSVECFHLVPDHFEMVLIDGCHCLNHVILETIIYGSKVVDGGWMLFHDTNPSIQQTMRDPHGPDIPEFHNSVLRAHKLMGFPSWPWQQRLTPHFEHRRKWGGMTGFRKEKDIVVDD